MTCFGGGESDRLISLLDLENRAEKASELDDRRAEREASDAGVQAIADAGDDCRRVPQTRRPMAEETAIAPADPNHHAARRAWRIGQPRDCYIYYMYYKDTMQHRAMSLMSKKMAAALALEGEFSEEGLAAMAGDGDDQMSLAKSMSEKIDDADMQRSWSKVKSLTEKKKPIKKKALPTLADLAADATPDKLDTLVEEAQLLARTILERQKEPVPASAMPDIISLAERFAKADEGMWGAARAMAFREEPAEVDIPFDVHTMDRRVYTPLDLPSSVETVHYEDDAQPIAAVCVPPTPEPPKGVPVAVTLFSEPVQVNAGETLHVEFTASSKDWEVRGSEVTVFDKDGKPNLKVHQPEPEKKVHAVVDDIEFDEMLLAKMFANLAAHGVTLQDLAG